MKIEPTMTHGGSKTGSLPDNMTVEHITAVLGFPPNLEGDPYKVKHEWGFKIDGEQCGIWDYKGARWSCYGPLHKLFPEYKKGAI